MGLLTGWIIASLIIGAIASNQNKGFWGGFLGSLFLSPILGLIIVLVSKPELVKCKYCQSEMNPNDIFCPACERDKKGISRDAYKQGAIQ